MSKAKKDELILIIGGGPAGLGAALAFDNNGYKNILVLEGRPDMNFDIENSYPVGLNVRGQNAVKSLFGSHTQPEVSKLGLRVDHWKITVGPGINVANFDSGLVVGTTRAEVTHLLYEESQRRGTIKVLFGHKAKSVDLPTRTVTCETKNGETKDFQAACLIIGDGYRSKVRDLLAEADKSLKIEQWPWNISFRVLLSDVEPKTDLDPYTHYIHNQIYISKFLNGRWSAGVSIKNDSPKFLSSNEATDKNVDELEKYLKKTAPPAAQLMTRDELKRFFSRSIFTGAVTKVSKLCIDKWALLLGDAAHSAIPATGEGINSALEDCLVLQNSLAKSENNLGDCLLDFEANRLEDVNALSNLAYSLARPSFKSGLQMVVLGMFKKFTGPSKEDFLFGKNSSTTKRYSEVIKIWEQQTKLLGGPNVPKA